MVAPLALGSSDVATAPIKEKPVGPLVCALTAHSHQPYAKHLKRIATVWHSPGFDAARCVWFSEIIARTQSFCPAQQDVEDLQELSTRRGVEGNIANTKELPTGNTITVLL